LENGYEQIVIFGAEFDSRAQRFDHLNRSARIFELDASITQEEKLKGFSKKKIMIPENLVFVPINFNKEGLEEKLTESGFEKNRKSLFILEGITMYLSGGAINTIFEFIKKVSGIHSLVLFDYIYAGVLRQESRHYGEKEIFKTVSKAGEGWTFGFEQGEIEDFLSRYGFDLKYHSSARELEDRYFKDPEGRIIGKINGTHCIVTGIKNSHRQKLLLDRKEDNVPSLGTIE
jgi:methyltransferase (TIGR00027 family)